MKRIMTALENVGLTQKPTEHDFILPKKNVLKKERLRLLLSFVQGSCHLSRTFLRNRTFLFMIFLVQLFLNVNLESTLKLVKILLPAAV